MTKTKGSELKVGDTIEVWWAPNRDTIIDIRPYNGPLSYLFPQGAAIAYFALNKGGMTIDLSDYFTLIDKNWMEKQKLVDRL